MPRENGVYGPGGPILSSFRSQRVVYIIPVRAAMLDTVTVVWEWFRDLERVLGHRAPELYGGALSCGPPPTTHHF